MPRKKHEIHTEAKQNDYKSVIGIVVKEIKANKSKRGGKKVPANQLASQTNEEKSQVAECADALTRSTKLIQ